MKYNWSKEKIESVIKNCDSFSDVLRALNIPIQGNNGVTLKKKILEYNIDFSHFTFGNKNKKKKPYIKAELYLRKGSKIQSSRLKSKLLKEGLKQNKCEICGIDTWMGKPIVCQLHHIDGDTTNNSIENLQMLCPNCHSQTENYCGMANKSNNTVCPICGCNKSHNAKCCIKCYNNTNCPIV